MWGFANGNMFKKDGAVILKDYHFYDKFSLNRPN